MEGLKGEVLRVAEQNRLLVAAVSDLMGDLREAYDRGKSGGAHGTMHSGRAASVSTPPPATRARARAP